MCRDERSPTDPPAVYWDRNGNPMRLAKRLEPQRVWHSWIRETVMSLFVRQAASTVSVWKFFLKKKKKRGGGGGGGKKKKGETEHGVYTCLPAPPNRIEGLEERY